MNRRKLQFSLRCAFVVLTVAALMAFWFRPRRIEVSFAIDEFTNELEWPSKNPYVGANVEVKNRSPNSLWYRAAGFDFPNFETYQKLKDEWQWSGQSMEPTEWVKFERGDSFVFVIPLNDDAKAFTVGLRFATRRGGEEVDVWSDEFAIHRPPQPPN